LGILQVEIGYGASTLMSNENALLSARLSSSTEATREEAVREQVEVWEVMHATKDGTRIA
jgi:hypothetical protein